MRQEQPPKDLQPNQDRSLYFRTDHLEADLKGLSARGGAVTLISQGLRFGLSMLGTVVLARLLTPKDYGLIGMVVVVTGFVAMFKDIGLSAATIQKSEITHGQISALFWVNVALGFLIMLLTALVAPAISWFYAEPRLTRITLVFAVGFLFGGLTVQHEALLRRRMRFTTLGVIDILSLLITYGVAIILALRGAGYWALAFSQLTTAIVYAAGVWIACGWRPGAPRRDTGVRPMLAFGGNLTGFTVINYFARNLDNMLIGRFWGPEQLGLYARAYQLLLLPIDQINTPITSVAMPTLSRMVDSPERYRQAYLRMLEKVAILTMPFVAFMIGTSDWLVRVVLGPQWLGVSRIFLILGIAGLVQPASGTAGWLFISQGRTRDMFKQGIVNGTIAIISIVAGLPWGAVGVATSYTAGYLCVRAPFLYWYVGRKSPVRTADLYRTMGTPLLSALCALLALFVFRRQVEIARPVVGLVIAFLIVLTVDLSVLCLLPAGRRAVQDFRSLLPLLLKRKRA